MTVEEARSIYLSFPDATESQHHGHPDFRVGNKIFATLQPDKGRAVVRIPEAIAEAAAAEKPESSRVVSRIGGMGWLAMDVAQVDALEFIPLAEMAFEMRRASRQ